MSSSPSSSTQPRPHWLDLLPPDILTTISSHLTKATDPRPLLPLLISTRACNHAALLNALSPSLSLIDIPFETLLPFLDNSTTLPHLIIQDRPEILNLLPALPANRITLHIHGFATLHTTIRSLSTLPHSSHLALSFPLPLRESITNPNITPATLLPVHHLPSLKELHFTCLKAFRLSQRPLWQALTAIPTITTVAITDMHQFSTQIFQWSSPQSPTLPFLSSRASVSLHGTDSLVERAVLIGKSVTKVADLTSTVSASQLLHLATSCPHLTHLNLRLLPSATKFLQTALQNIPNIRSLILHNASVIPLSSTNIFISSIHQAPNLTEISLTGFHTPLSELQAIMKHIGPRLEVFDASIDNQTQTPLEMCIALCNTAIKFNRALRSFLHNSAKFSHKLEKRDRIESLARRALVMLRQLDLRATLLSNEKLIERIRALSRHENSC